MYTRTRHIMRIKYSIFIIVGLLLVSNGWTQDKKPAADPAKRQVYFGEQHLHTVNSPDAFAMGTRNTPDDAYNFAKGKAVKKNTTGEMVQKKTPYDWCAVTDHAEYLGVMPLLLDPKSPLRDTPIGKMIGSGDPSRVRRPFKKSSPRRLSTR